MDMNAIARQLDNHLNKCRCCFKLLKSSQKTVEISKSISQRFLSLTNIQLIIDDSFSSVICVNCNSKLSEFSDFQRELSENQTVLYQFHANVIPKPSQDQRHHEVEEDEQFIQIEESEHPIKSEEETVYEEQEVMVEENIETSQLFPSPKASESSKASQSTKEASIWSCGMCDEKFASRAKLRHHEKEHGSPPRAHNSKTGQRKMCQICGISFAINGFYHHMQRAHYDGIRFSCDFCGKGFRVKHDLKDHIKKHMSIESREKFECATCNATLLSKAALKNHEQYFHAGFIEEFVCECGKSFTSRIKFHQHRITVHVKGNFPCPSCNKVYTVKNALQKHIEKNHKAKAPCTLCGKLVTPGMFMNQHMKTHEPAQHQCTYEGCEKAFRTRSALSLHGESHEYTTVDLPCPSCNTMYSSQRNLNRHIARQHSNYRVQCEVPGCTYTASRKDYLASHFRSHKDINEEFRNVLLTKMKQIKVIPW